MKIRRLNSFCFILCSALIGSPAVAAANEADHGHDHGAPATQKAPTPAQAAADADHDHDHGHAHPETDGNHSRSEPSAEHSQHAEEAGSHSDHEEHGAHDEHGDEAKGHEDHAENSHGGHDDHEQAPLVFSEALLHEFGAKIATADAGIIRQQVSLPGEVQLNREAVAHITPRFPAKTLSVVAKTGDSVSAGQTLATAESSETLARFQLQSLIDGVVISRHITLGEHLTPDDTAFVIADLSMLWVDIALYPKQVPLVKQGQPTTISTRYGPGPVNTQVGYVAPLINENTRTGLARVFLDNSEQQWKPGMFIKADITVGEFHADIVVPKSAVIELEGRPRVFVRQGGVWEPRPVKLGREDATSVEILGGLNHGEQFVSEGGFVLKAQLQKSEFESGHNH